jgi:IS30 family transposase
MLRIRDRPASVTERQEAGHWEGDLVMGARPSAIITLVERRTRFLKIIRLPNGYKAADVRVSLTAGFEQVLPTLRRSLTWDRGREMAEHQELTAQLGIPVYFCDPRSPWQRGSNENANRLLRQYCTKNADLRIFTQVDLDVIAHRINTRPRKILDWATSHDHYNRAMIAALTTKDLDEPRLV